MGLLGLGTSSMRSAFRFTTSRGGENSTGTMGIFASALTGWLAPRKFCALSRTSCRPALEASRPFFLLKICLINAEADRLGGRNELNAWLAKSFNQHDVADCLVHLR